MFEHRCLNCGAKVNFGEFICDNCSMFIYEPSHTKSIYDIYHMGYYKDSLAILIKEFKYNKNLKIGKYLTDILCEYFRSIDIENHDYYVSYVPSNYFSIYNKGFIPAKIIADRFAKNFGLKVINLFKSKSYKRQASLSLNERHKNIQKKIKITTSIPKYLIIVDDVYTTGASMIECMNIIKKNVNFCLGLTLAKAHYGGDSFEEQV